MKKLLLVILCMFIVSGCAMGENEEHQITFDETPKKVISLSSSWAQIWQLAGGDLIGVSSDALDKEGLQLANSVQVVGTIKDPNMELILSLQPDLVLLSQDISSHTQIAQTLKEAKIAYYMGKVESFTQYKKMLQDFVQLTNNQEAYTQYGMNVEKQIEDLLAKVPTSSEQSALFLRSFSTGVKAKASEHIVCDILDTLHIKNIAKKEGFPLEDISMEAIMKENPDYIFVVAMGDEEKAKIGFKEMLQQDPAWQTLQTVQNNQVYFLEKELYHYKPNERWAEAYENIIKIIYPDIII